MSATATQVALDVDPGAEERQRRVGRARACLGRLAPIEAQLLDVEARLPALVREVKGIREELASVVAPIAEDGD